MTDHGAAGHAAAAAFADSLKQHFGDRLEAVTVERDEVTAELAPARWLEVMHTLRDEPTFAFEQLIDLCGIDYLSWGQAEWDTTNVTAQGFSRGVEGGTIGRFDWAGRPHPAASPRRFAVVAHLLSLQHNRRLRLRAFCADDDLPSLPTLNALWPSVNWFEREAFDLFGIVFEGHPDLRRILTDYGFVGHPFRKDFPLIGNVEVRYDPEKQRVVYEPVKSVEPRVLVPRVVREDSRWAQASFEDQELDGK